MPNAPKIKLEILNLFSDIVQKTQDATTANTQSAQDLAIANLTTSCQNLTAELLTAPPPGASTMAQLVTFPLAMMAGFAAANASVLNCSLASPSPVNLYNVERDALADALNDWLASVSLLDPYEVLLADAILAMRSGDLEALAGIANELLGELGHNNVTIDEEGVVTVLEPTIFSALQAAFADYGVTFNFGQELQQYSPLVFDLDGDGVELSALSGVGAAPVYWDMDNDGFAEASGWVKPDDGLLVRDINSNGTIDSQNELFGDAATDGFTALTALDSNSDNQITSADTNFSSLKIWKDTNQDGVSQSGELFSLASLGVTSISLGDSAANYDLAGNHVSHESTFVIGGNTRTVVDAWFSYDSMNTIYKGSHTLDLTASVLPELRGYGNIPDLSIAMSENDDLLDKVVELVELDIVTDPGEVAGLVREIIHLWGGVEGVDPAIRGTAAGWADADGRDIAFIEKLVDKLAVPNDPDGWVSGPRGTVYEDMFREFTTAMTARLLLQSSGSDFFEEMPVYNPATDTFTGSFTLDMDAIEAALDGKSFADVVATWSNILSMLVGSVGLAGIDSTTKAALNTAINDSDPNHLLTFDSFVSPTLDYTIVFPGESSPGYTGAPGLGVVMGVGGFDVHTGTSEDESITLSTLVGLSPKDQIVLAGDDNDTISGAYGNDTIFGEGGNDLFQSLQWGINKLYGGAGDDTFVLNGGSDKMQGSIVDGGTGANKLIVNGDMTGISVSNVQTLEVNSVVTLTATQLSAFSTLITTSGGVIDLYASAPGNTYDISAKAGDVPSDVEIGEQALLALSR